MSQGMKHKRSIIFAAYPNLSGRLRTIFSGTEGSIQKRLEKPPVLREYGWDLQTYERARIICGELVRVMAQRKNRSIKIIDLYPDGTLIFAACADSKFLGWLSPSKAPWIHPIALVEAKLIVPDKQLTRIEFPFVSVPKKRGRLFYFDEANVSWCPKSGRVYRVIGEEYKVNTPGKNLRKYLIGSLEYPTGEGLYEIYERKRNQEVQTHWQNLIEMYEDDYLFVVRDNASSHVTPELDPFLVSQSHRFCLVPLPTYSPHLNLIERLWHLMRDQINRSYFHESLTQLCEGLVGWLDRLPFSRFRSLMGVENYHSVNLVLP
jgi:hypothetical protein